MKRRFLIAVFAGMMSIAVIGGLLYGVVFASLFRENIVSLEAMKQPPGFSWIALSHLPFSVLLTLVVSWRGRLSAWGGASTGALLGFLMASSYNFSQYGTVNHWTLKLTLIEPLITMVMVGAAGAAVGAVLGAGKRTQVAA